MQHGLTNLKLQKATDFPHGNIGHFSTCLAKYFFAKTKENRKTLCARVK